MFVCLFACLFVSPFRLFVYVVNNSIIVLCTRQSSTVATLVQDLVTLISNNLKWYSTCL